MITSRSPAPSQPRRGSAWQQPRRQAERCVRTHSVAFCRWGQQQGLPRAAAARHLGLPPRTLNAWCHRWHVDRLCARPRGRPCQRATPHERNDVIHFLREVGPRVGLPTLRAQFPGFARGELQDVQRRFRYVYAHQHPRLLHTLHWHRPGAVWAMDHAEPPTPIDGHYPYLLAVRDLATGCQLAWLPVQTTTAEETVAALTSLFQEHGPPLLLKSDNGSAFIAKAMNQFLNLCRVVPLFSPPGTPQYNGSCEAGIGAMKTRTHTIAAAHDRPGRWTSDDVEAARQMANQLTRPWGPTQVTPEQAWQLRQPITAADRHAFEQVVVRQRRDACQELGYSVDMVLTHWQQARVDRVAIRRACVERGLLSLSRRSITPAVHSLKLVKIS